MAHASAFLLATRWPLPAPHALPVRMLLPKAYSCPPMPTQPAMLGGCDVLGLVCSPVNLVAAPAHVAEGSYLPDMVLTCFIPSSPGVARCAPLKIPVHTCEAGIPHQLNF